MTTLFTVVQKPTVATCEIDDHSNKTGRLVLSNNSSSCRQSLRRKTNNGSYEAHDASTSAAGNDQKSAAASNERKCNEHSDNATLVELILRLQTLAQRANEIFCNVRQESEAISRRTESLFVRIRVFEQKTNGLLTKIPSILKYRTLSGYTSVLSHYHLAFEQSTNLFLPESRSTEIAHFYDKCGKLEADSSLRKAHCNHATKTVPKLTYEDRESQTTATLQRGCKSELHSTNSNAAVTVFPRKRAETLQDCATDSNKSDVVAVDTSGIVLKRLKCTRSSVLSSNDDRTSQNCSTTSAHYASLDCNASASRCRFTAPVKPSLSAKQSGSLLHQEFHGNGPRDLSDGDILHRQANGGPNQSVSSTMACADALLFADDENVYENYDLFNEQANLKAFNRRKTFAANFTQFFSLRRPKKKRAPLPSEYEQLNQMQLQELRPVLETQTGRGAPRSETDPFLAMSTSATASTLSSLSASSGLKGFLRRSFSSLRRPKKSTSYDEQNHIYENYVSNLANRRAQFPSSYQRSPNKPGAQPSQASGTIQRRTKVFSHGLIPATVRHKNCSRTTVEQRPMDADGKKICIPKFPRGSESTISVGSSLSVNLIKHSNAAKDCGHYREGFRLEYPNECLSSDSRESNCVATRSAYDAKQGLIANASSNNSSSLNFAEDASPTLAHYDDEHTYYSYSKDLDDYSIDSSSAYSCDPEGYYTTMHNDSGLNRQAAVRVSGRQQNRVNRGEAKANASSGRPKQNAELARAIIRSYNGCQHQQSSSSSSNEDASQNSRENSKNSNCCSNNVTADVKRSAPIFRKSPQHFSESKLPSSPDCGKPNRSSNKEEPKTNAGPYKLICIGEETIPEEQLDDWLLLRLKEEQRQPSSTKTSSLSPLASATENSASCAIETSRRLRVCDDGGSGSVSLSKSVSYPRTIAGARTIDKENQSVNAVSGNADKPQPRLSTCALTASNYDYGTLRITGNSATNKALQSIPSSSAAYSATFPRKAVRFSEH